MPTQVQFRRGTTSQNDSFTGANGEISVDTNLDQLRLHDGFTAGGFKVGRGVDVDDRMQVANTQALHSSVTANLNSYIANTNPRITNLNSSGEHTAHFIPSANITYDLGSDTQRWRDIYLSGTSINLGDATITAQGSAITLPSGSSISGTGDITNLVNDRMQVANTQALHSSVTANLNSYIANTNPRISNLLTSVSGTNTAIRALVTTESGRIDNVLTSISGTNTSIRTLVSDRMQVANTIALANARLGATATVQITGDVAGGPTAFSGNTVSIAVTQQNNSVDLGTHTTGNYVATIAGTANEVEVSGSGSETAAVTIGLPDNVTVTGDLTVSGGDITLGGTGRIQGIDTVSAGTDAANKTYVDNAVAGVVDSAPAALDTLNELAAALGDDANFATTVSTNIGQKLGATATVALTGDVTGSGSFSANAVSIATTIQPNSVALGTDTTGNYIASLTVGTGLDTTTATGEGSTPNITLDLSELSTSTADGDGDFFVVVDASNVQRKLTKGNIAISGFNTTNGIALGTDTTGNYVATITGGTGIDSSAATSGEGTTHTLSLDLNELATSTTNADGDYFVVVDSADGSQHKLTKANINISGFNNDAGYSTTTGTVTSVSGGTGLTGTVTSSGSISLATAGVGAGTYGSTADGTKIDTITVDAYGRVTAVATGSTGSTSTSGTVTSVGVSAGTGLSGGGTVTSSGTISLALDMSELTDMTATMVGTDEFIVLDGGADRRKAANEIGLSIFNNDAGFSTTTGTVTSHTVSAGNGLTGGGTVTSSGTTTLNVGAGTGVTVSADAVSIGQAVGTGNSPTFAGMTLNGTLTLGSNVINDVEDIYLRDRIFHDADTDTYIQFHNGNEWRVVVGGTERLEVKNASPHVLVTGTLNATTDVQVNGTSVATSADVNGKAIAFSIVFG